MTQKHQIPLQQRRLTPSSGRSHAPSTPQAAPNHPKRMICQVSMARLQRRREFRAKIGHVECPKTGLPALNSAQMAQGEAAGKIPSCSRESWGEKVQELALQPAAPWLLREVLAKPEHKRDISGAPSKMSPLQPPPAGTQGCAATGAAGRGLVEPRGRAGDGDGHPLPPHLQHKPRALDLC